MNKSDDSFIFSARPSFYIDLHGRYLYFKNEVPDRLPSYIYLDLTKAKVQPKLFALNHQDDYDMPLLIENNNFYIYLRSDKKEKKIPFKFDTARQVYISNQ